ncbi:MAG: 2-dehydropantoate 2-reductase [Magnetococcus sp. YQC-3]
MNPEQNIASPTLPPRVLVVGSGAVGGYYGAQLAKAGAKVATLQRSDYHVVQEQGIHIDSINGAHHFQPDQVLQDLSAYHGFPDYMLVCLKVLEKIHTPEIIRPAVGPETTILLLQNGVEIEEKIANAFPENELLSGLAFVCLNRTSPGHIQHTCYGHLTIGRYPHGSSPRATQLAQLFEKAGTACPVTENIGLERWKKLVWNAAFNPVSVLGQATTQEMLAHPPTARLIQQIMEEVCSVAKAAGYVLPDGIVQKNLQATQRMKPYKTSMLLDYLAGRPMEIEAILGNAIRAAQRHRMTVPHLESVHALLSLFARSIGLEPGNQDIGLNQ